MPQKSDDIKKLERRAKAMLLDKDIPPAKMDVVRSLLNNSEIAPWERYGAIISLIQTCPDKPRPKQRAERVEIKSSRAVRRSPSSEEAHEQRRAVVLEPGSIFVNLLYAKYRNLRLFKKRYLIHAPNRLGIGIRKRLIPSKRMLSVIGAVVGEFVSASAGLGYLINFGRGTYDTPLVIAAVFTLTALALLLYGVAAWLESVLLDWQDAA